MDKRYQVFVSSTYQDLQAERQEVMHALLELDCIPSGMELFPAANESQWSLIKRVIEECDYYVLVLAGRYGTCGSEGLSYTEMEYRHAVKIGKPTIAFLHKDPGTIPANKTEATKEGKDKLAMFRSLVESKLCKHWTTPAELGSVVSRSLIQLIKTCPGIGWVRADELPNRNAALELLKLRQRVDELEGELARSRTSAPKGTEEFAQGDDTHTIRYSFQSKDTLEYLTKNWTATLEVTWNEIFKVLTPMMIHEAAESDLKSAMDKFVGNKGLPNLRKRKELTDLSLRNFSLDGNDFQTIKVQLRALGLITKSERPRSVKDLDTYWTITPYGDEIMTRLMAVKNKPTREQSPIEEKSLPKQ